jgi:hypothetical protein
MKGSEKTDNGSWRQIKIQCLFIWTHNASSLLLDEHVSATRWHSSALARYSFALVMGDFRVSDLCTLSYNHRIDHRIAFYACLKLRFVRWIIRASSIMRETGS